MSLLKEDDDREFTAECRQMLSNGVVLTRIHIIKQPLTPYIEWETEYYRRISVPLRGEQVYIVNHSDIEELVLPDGGLMIFDRRHAAQNHYDDSGWLLRTDFYDAGDAQFESFLQLKSRLKNGPLQPIGP